MNDELKQPEAFEEPDEELEAEVEEDTAEENDADIDRYIRTLTGQEVPQEPEKEKKAPEVEHFRVTSQIGEDDHKALDAARVHYFAGHIVGDFRI